MNRSAQPKKFKSGWAIVDGKRCYFRSSWEVRFAAYLGWLRKNRQIKDFRYEPKTFWFEKIKRGVRSYKPDFEVLENDGTSTFYEIKGYMDPKSKTKLKRMKLYHKDIKIILIDSKAYHNILKQIGNLA